MRILVTSVRFPFISGGAESLSVTLVEELKKGGHKVELMTAPFRFDPPEAVRRYMDLWESEDLDGMGIDTVICLSFPTYYLRHQTKITWLLHQHRAVYDLWDSPFSNDRLKNPDTEALRSEIIERDTFAFTECRRVFTISKRVSERLLRFNDIESTPVYPPSRLRDRFYSEPSEPFVFFPSRLEGLKRQTLLIEAMNHVESPVAAILAGEGGQRAQLERMIVDFGLEEKVVLVGRITDEELLAFYARCLVVFFGPYDEDLGFVTQEAMLSKKPVITCSDSGGATELVTDTVTGLVVEPTAEAVAKAIDLVYGNPVLCERMGIAAYQHLSQMQVSWDRVIRSLIGEPAAS